MEIPTGGDIRAARKRKEMTQAELAERAGVSQPLIARIESNGVDPTVDTLYSVVSALNDSTSELDQEEVEMSLPSVLKDARKRTGYTQRELAERAGVSQPLVSRIERQDINPRSSTLRSLFSCLDPSLDSGGGESAMQSTTNLNLLENIEQEFEKIQDSSSPTEQNGRAGESSDERPHCPECGLDFTPYPDPNYCPNCGSEP